MKHLLPQLEQLIQRHFLYVENINDIPPQFSEHLPIFYKKKHNTYYTHSRYLSKYTPSELPWNETVTITCDQTIPDTLDALRKYHQLLVVDQSNQPIGFLDIETTLESVHTAYQHLKAYFDTVIETMDASISVIDDTGKVVIWTKGAEEIFSIKAEEIIGRPMSDFFPVDMLQVFDTLKTGKSLYREQHQPRSDLFVLINTNPVRLNNTIIGAVAAETDITSQVRLNRELFHATNKIHHLEQEMAKINPAHDPFHQIKGTSLQIRETKDMIKKVGTTKATVLILGESGVGKELFAKAVHHVREHPDAPFIAINCGAIPPTLFESELFGYEKGAFSGADSKGKKGKIELAKGGTLFLDEVGELPLEMQVKFLRVLEEKKYYRIGGTKEVEADVRIIAATNQNLKQLVKDGKFREDLFYRLNVITIQIPPLRDRIEDIVELSHHFLYEFSVKYNKVIYEIPHTVMHALMQYHWPGNVRELRNVIERLVIFAHDGHIKPEDLPFDEKSKQTDRYQNHNQVGTITSSLQAELDSYEKTLIMKALELENGNKLAAAKRLGISRATLYNKINRLGI